MQNYFRGWNKVKLAEGSRQDAKNRWAFFKMWLTLCWGTEQNYGPFCCLSFYFFVVIDFYHLTFWIFKLLLAISDMIPILQAKLNKVLIRDRRVLVFSEHFGKVSISLILGFFTGMTITPALPTFRTAKGPMPAHSLSFIHLPCLFTFCAMHLAEEWGSSGE